MRPGITLAIISLLFTGISRAQLALPQIIIKEENRSLDLVEIAIEANIEGTLAETILDLEYFNSGRRNAEGEFTLQLPPGATLSTYALEVNGEMRPGVSVEKEQARFAYESIKARNIDPGLVEREANNLYRTRIFPIFGNKTKRVRVGFIHSIPDGAYVFPLKTNHTVETFSCIVSGTLAKAPVLVSNQKPREPGDAFGDYAWTFDGINPMGRLSIQAKLPEDRKHRTDFEQDNEGNLYFVTQGKLAPEEERVTPNQWKSFRLIWDISHSGNWRDHDAEFAALKKIIQFAGDCSIQVHFLNETLHPAKKFQIRKGNTDTLIKHLKSPLYLGNADFSRIPHHRGKTLLFSDGSAALPRWALPKRKRDHDIYLLHSDTTKLSATVAGNASHILDINAPHFVRNFEEATNSVKFTNIANDSWDYSKAGENFI